MKIVIIGTGNVAAILGRKFRKAGHQIIQILGRDSSEASKLAYEWDTESANYISLIHPGADVYLVAVSDQAIAQVVKDMHLPNKVVAHTAGSVDKSILETVSPHHGVFYPLQSLRKELADIPDTPIFTDGATSKARQVLHELAESVSSHPVKESDAGKRVKLHIAAIVVNNFTNYLYSLAKEFCDQEGIDFKTLQPLIEETAVRLRNTDPAKVQTGPAMRNDQATIESHLAILQDHPRLREIYAYLTSKISEKGRF